MARVSKKVNAYVQPTPSSEKKQKNEIYKTALYARLSVEDNGKYGDSLDAQIQFLEHYIKDKPQFAFCGTFSDNGFTGTNYERPQFKKLIELVQAGEIDCMIVKDLSRLGRNYIETGNFLEKICPLLNLRLIAINDRFDTENLNSNSEMSMSVANIANDMYAKDISRKICASLQTKMKSGGYIGSYAPYGYLKDPEDKNHLIPDPVTAPIIQRIYRLRSEGMGVGSILILLNEEGVPSPGRYRFECGIVTNNNKKGKELLWNRHVLRDILTNIVYIGHLAQGKGRSALYKGITFHGTQKEEWVISHDTHEPILDTDLFEQVQDINEKQAKAHKENCGKYSYLPKAVNPYGKRLVCADCGSTIKLFRSISSKKDKAYFTFKCPKYEAHKERGCSAAKSISQEELDRAVLETIRAHINLFVEHKALVEGLQRKRLLNSGQHQMQEEIRMKQEKIQQQEMLRSGLYLDLKDGLLTEGEYLYSKQTFTKSINELENEINHLKSNQDSAMAAMDQYAHWLHLAETYEKAQTLSTEMIDSFIMKIELHVGKKVEIQLNYMDEFQRAMAEIQSEKGEVA